MRRIIFPLVVTLLSLPIADAASAQVGPRLSVGSRLRVSTTMSPNRWVEGSLTALTAERLQVDQQSFSLDAIQRLEVHHGRTSRIGAGLLIGALGGAVVGLASYELSKNSYIGEDYWRPIHLGLGAGAGLAIGGIVGALTHADRWRAVPQHDWTLSVGPGPSGTFAVGMSTRR